jgi:hypothetical protein
MRLATWIKDLARLIGEWWGIMAGALSVPFLLLSLFNVFSGRVLFAALAFVSLLVLVIAQHRRISALTAAPPKLTVLPGYHVRSDDPNSVFVNLSLSSNSTELHNINGEYWTDQRFVLIPATQPTKYIQSKTGPAVFAYYDFSRAMLHKNTSIQIAEWKFRTPSEGEFIPIGIRVVSSETSWQAENWRVVCDGKQVRITTPAP